MGVAKQTYAIFSHHCLVTGQGKMSTFLWVPEDHPEEQYRNMQEQAQVCEYLCGWLSHEHTEACMRKMEGWPVVCKLTL